MIRVGTLDDEIPKIGITDLFHDLVDFPILTGLVLIAIRDSPIIVILSQHKLQDIADDLDLPIDYDDGFCLILFCLFVAVLMHDVHFLYELLLED